MGHSSIRVTVDTYGHLIPGANVSHVDRLDQTPKEKQALATQPSPPRNHGMKMKLAFLRILLILLVAGGRIELPTYGL
jgi:hypothetical protein